MTHGRTSLAAKMGERTRRLETLTSSFLEKRRSRAPMAALLRPWRRGSDVQPRRRGAVLPAKQRSSLLEHLLEEVGELHNAA
jgi:hypothetical protein